MKPNALLKVLAVVVVAAAVLMVLIMKQRAAPKADPVAEGLAEVIPIADIGPATETGAEREAAASAAIPAGSLPRLVDLGATTCIPCKKMAPILDQLAEDFAGQMEVVFIDVRKNRAAGVPYKIRVIPTQIFYDPEGKELFRHEGFFSREDILAKWAEFGFEFSAESEQAEGA
ncbi:MAG: thioredoxin family protein [Phycisphaerales bacterium]|nr:MAG: thioredoxin family protein [Phycisphaerales bacterium]